MIRYEHYIDGTQLPPSSGEFLPTENPYTGKVWAEIARGNRGDAEAAVAAAQRAFSAGAWPALTPSERGRMLWRLGDLVVAHAPRLAEIEQRDNGKLAAEVVTQVRYMGDYFRYYAGLADKVQSAVIPTDKKGVFAYTRYEPKGVIAIITPWNSPLTLTSWKLAPALAAGFTAVIKPSEFTSASMIELAKLFTEAGFPNGVVNVATGPIWVPASVGSPSLTSFVKSISLATKVSWIERCTRSRDPAWQLWPVAAKIPETTPLTACSRSASSKTMLGDLPPSSSVTVLKLRAASS